MIVRLAIIGRYAKKRELKDLLYEYSDRFSNTLGCTDFVEHRIKVNSETPIACKLYPVADSLKRQVKEQITELYEQGHIEEAEGISICSFDCVLRSEERIGFVCCDLRAINSVTISDEYPMSDLTELIDTAAGAQYVST